MQSQAWQGKPRARPSSGASNMAPAHKGIRYGGRKSKSKTGKPAKTTSLRMPSEFMEFIKSRIDAGDAQTLAEYLIGLVREAAKRHGVTL